MGFPVDDFVKPLPDFLLCPVCKECLHDPLEVCEKAHVIQASAERESSPVEVIEPPTSCGICKAELIVEPYEARSLVTIINGLEVYCDNLSRGCSWTGAMSEVLEHVDECAYHARQCPAAEQGCTFEGVASEVAEHRDTKCPYTLVRCPRGCDDEMRERRELSIHERVCGAWPCTVTPGCATVTTKRRVGVHESWCKDRNIDLKKLKREKKMLKEEVVGLKKQLAPHLTASQAAALPARSSPTADDDEDEELTEQDDDEDAAEERRASVSTGAPVAASPRKRPFGGSLLNGAKKRAASAVPASQSSPSKRPRASFLAQDFEERAEEEERARSQSAMPPSTAPARLTEEGGE
ncbi:hypothetical protein JCM10449v2_001014 [Rhodotorula kratochvilovae]